MALYALQPVGVLNTVTLQVITPANYVEWNAYLDWLTAGNAPDPLVVLDPYPTITEQRVEARARLGSVRARRAEHGTITAAGDAWTVTPFFWLAVITHRIVMPPIPPGFTLPNAAGVQVPINNAALSQIAEALSARAIAMNVRYAALRAAIDAAGVPLAVDLEVGWPS